MGGRVHSNRDKGLELGYIIGLGFIYGKWGVSGSDLKKKNLKKSKYKSYECRVSYECRCGCPHEGRWF
jgi:hypothetical protein